MPSTMDDERVAQLINITLHTKLGIKAEVLRILDHLMKLGFLRTSVDTYFVSATQTTSGSDRSYFTADAKRVDRHSNKSFR